MISKVFEGVVGIVLISPPDTFPNMLLPERFH